MEEKLKKAKEITKKYGQEHLLAYYDSLSEQDKLILLDQILAIDFTLMQELYEKTKQKELDQEEKIEPIPYIDKINLAPEGKEEYEKTGEEIIRNQKLACVTMAGGQGTRLGHNGPKGIFDLGLESHKSIFQLLCERLKEEADHYQISIPWYIMTSNQNHTQSKEFFEKNNYFGFPKEDIRFFNQGELPMINTQGKIMLDKNKCIKEAADGHGGVFEALAKSGCLEDMENRKIDWVFIAGVDNVLAKMVDPLLLGIVTKQQANAAGKSVAKKRPTEKVGVFCKKNGKPSVVEYTEISEEMANRLDERGGLAFGESHLLCNMFHIKILKEIAKNKLPYHVAFKKADYYDTKGNLIKPETPNAYKFETFMFDAFNTIDKMSILRVKREEEFAPVKNAQGEDSPETARELYTNYQKNK